MSRKLKPVPDGENLNWLSYRIAQHENSIKELLATVEMHIRESSSAVGQDQYKLARTHAQMAKNQIDALMQDFAAFRQLNWAQNYTPPPTQKIT